MTEQRAMNQRLSSAYFWYDAEYAKSLDRICVALARYAHQDLAKVQHWPIRELYRWFDGLQHLLKSESDAVKQAK